MEGTRPSASYYERYGRFWEDIVVISSFSYISTSGVTFNVTICVEKEERIQALYE